LINGQSRLETKQDCQAILTTPDACVTCPLAIKQPEDAPSPFFRHLLYLSETQAAGAQFLLSDLMPIEWEGLKILKRKRDEKQIEEMQKRSRKS
jgi:hypothetical protein